LKSAAIYGANASGKSNLISAVKIMRQLVLDSSKDTQANESIPVEPFRLSTETIEQPSLFEMVFVINGRRYRYGFETTTEKIVSEWLFHVPTIREAKLFERRKGKFEVTAAFKEAKALEDKTRDNALFLSVVAQFNGKISQTILGWFENLMIISGLNDTNLRPHTLRALESETYRDEILSLFKKLDVGIDDVQIRKSPIPTQTFNDVPEEFKRVSEEIERIFKGLGMKKLDVLTSHRKFNSTGQAVGTEVFDLDNQESEGTRKLFSMVGLFVDTLTKGHLLLVDELDARLHPLITRTIIGLFNSKETNPQNGQLAFAAHDTNLLSKDIFRRDQIWFVEKDQFGATHLYSLVEYKVRNDASFESDYIRGKYGAIPFVGDLSRIFGEPKEKAQAKLQE
jgi:AAA15 family ATPase/GTPase